MNDRDMPEVCHDCGRPFDESRPVPVLPGQEASTGALTSVEAPLTLSKLLLQARLPLTHLAKHAESEDFESVRRRIDLAADLFLSVVKESVQELNSNISSGLVPILEFTREVREAVNALREDIDKVERFAEERRVDGWR